MPSFVAAQSRHQVHSKEQISASRVEGGRSRSQHSQFGRSSSMALAPERRRRLHRPLMLLALMSIDAKRGTIPSIRETRMARRCGGLARRRRAGRPDLPRLGRGIARRVCRRRRVFRHFRICRRPQRSGRSGGRTFLLRRLLRPTRATTVSRPDPRSAGDADRCAIFRVDGRLSRARAADRGRLRFRGQFSGLVPSRIFRWRCGVSAVDPPVVAGRGGAVLSVLPAVPVGRPSAEAGGARPGVAAVGRSVLSGLLRPDAGQRRRGLLPALHPLLGAARRGSARLLESNVRDGTAARALVESRGLGRARPARVVPRLA